MLSDIDPACEAIALALFQKEKESPLGWRMVQRKTTLHTHENLSSFMVEWTKRLQKLLQFGDPPCAELLESVTSSIAKRNTNMREAVVFSQHLYITLSYFDTVNTSNDLKFISTLQYVPNHWN